jgi:hypothetical protein
VERLKEFHNDEAGMSSLQAILTIAIAAVILGLLKVFWNDIKNWFAISVAPVLGWEK